MIHFFFFFKQKTANEIYQCDWSSDVCSSDLGATEASITGTINCHFACCRAFRSSIQIPAPAQVCNSGEGIIQFYSNRQDKTGLRNIVPADSTPRSDFQGNCPAARVAMNFETKPNLSCYPYLPVCFHLCRRQLRAVVSLNKLKYFYYRPAQHAILL